MKPYYSDALVTIYHGDCREIVPTLDGVNVLCTDPPYGIAHKSNGQRFIRAKQIAGDHNCDLAEWVREWASARSVPAIVFFSPYQPLAGFRSVLCWDKGAHVGIGGDRETCWKRDFELIGIEGNGVLTGKRDSAVCRYPALLPPPSGHFAEKPIPLLLYLLQKVGGDVVLDPFAGSGPTLRAAKDLGRRAIGIEIEEKYCEIAAERCRQEVLDLGA